MSDADVKARLRTIYAQSAWNARTYGAAWAVPHYTDLIKEIDADPSGPLTEGQKREAHKFKLDERAA